MSEHSQTRRHRRVRVAQSWTFSSKSIVGDTKSSGIRGILSKSTDTAAQKSSLKIFWEKCAPVAELVDEWVTLKPSLHVEEMYSWYPYIRFFWFFHFEIRFFVIFWKCYQFSSKIIKWLVVDSEITLRSCCKIHRFSKNQEKMILKIEKSKKSNVRISWIHFLNM